MSGSVAALFQRLTQGVYLVGVAHAERRNVFTAAWVMQVSFGPMLLALSINPRNSSYALLQEGRAFAVNVLKTSSARSGRAVRAAGPCRHIAFGRVDNQRSRPALAARGAGLVRMRNRGRVPCRRSRAGGGQGDRWQAAGLRSRALVLSPNRSDGRRICAVSRCLPRFMRWLTSVVRR